MSNAPLDPHPGSARPRAPEDPFTYTTKPIWDIDRPQPAFLALAQAGAIRGQVLDVGCGTGEHVLMCASLGLAATGVDLAVAALDTARRKARERGLSARFLRQDARELAGLKTREPSRRRHLTAAVLEWGPSAPRINDQGVAP